jgi:hypothetical protein
MASFVSVAIMITLKEHMSKSNRDPSNSAEKYARELRVRMRHFREDIGEICHCQNMNWRQNITKSITDFERYEN